jgi:hypothetical protein
MPFPIRPLHRFPLAYWSGFMSLMTLLLLSSGPAHAEWVRIDQTDEGMTTYVDPDSMRHKGGLVKMWQLYDFKTMQTVAGDPYMSSKIQSEYDCTEERSRRLAFTNFSGNMGSDKPVYTNSDEGKWKPVAPKSIGEALWEFACRKK